MVMMRLVSFALVVAFAAAQLIPDQYIVVFKDGTSSVHRNKHMTVMEVAPMHVYGFESFFGYAAKMNASAAEAVAARPEVKYVEQDQLFHATQGCTTQSGSTWGLARISHRTLSSTTYVFPYSLTGSGVDAYIVDTGIQANHPNFGGRVIAGTDQTGSGSTNDQNGHGTHVAGTVGSTTYGVAKQVTLIPVKVLNAQGSGSTSGIVAGMQWITNSHRSRGRRSVANMSLGGGASTAMDDAVRSTIGAGVSVVVAAGNSNANACNTSPARVTTAVTVGSIGTTAAFDTRSDFSNFGTCLNVFAPGFDVLSTWINSGTRSISGTSMAAPHVAGAVAQYLQRTSATPAQVQTHISSTASSGVVNPGSGSPNRILYSPCV